VFRALGRMVKLMKTLTTAALALTLVAAPAAAETAPSELHADVEVDPTAYVLSGYSLHAGVGWQRFRLDLGIFAMDVPEMMHGNPGWDASFAGGGAKLQWFPLAEQHELFVDVAASASRRDMTLQATGASERATVFAVGASAGWRFALPYNLYATPWVGFNVDLEETEVMLDGETFEMSRVTPFAAVHLGYRFR